MILVELLKLNEKQEKDTRCAEQEWAEKNKLTDEECEVMAIILNSMKKSGSDISRIRAYRNSSGYVDLCDVYEVFKFKVSSKKSFVIIPAKFSHLNAPTEPCTKTEGGDEYTRLLFNNPFELDAYGKTLSDVYSEMLTREGNYLNKYEADFFARADFFELTDAELIACLESAKNRQIEKEKQREELEAIIKEKELRETEKKAALKEKKKVLEIKKEKDKEAAIQKQEAIRKMLESGHPFTFEEIQSIAIHSAENGKRAVLQLDDDGNILKIYESVAEASKRIGLAPKTIRDVANGKYKHGGGFCWKYADEIQESCLESKTKEELNKPLE